MSGPERPSTSADQTIQQRKHEESEMSIVTVMPSGQSIEVAEGTTILAALLGLSLIHI